MHQPARQVKRKTGNATEDVFFDVQFLGCASCITEIDCDTYATNSHTQYTIFRLNKRRIY